MLSSAEIMANSDAVMANSDAVVVSKTWLAKVHDDMSVLVSRFDKMALSAKKPATKEEQEGGIRALNEYVKERTQTVATINGRKFLISFLTSFLSFFFVEMFFCKH